MLKSIKESVFTKKANKIFLPTYFALKFVMELIQTHPTKTQQNDFIHFGGQNFDLEHNFWVLPNQTMPNCLKNYCSKLIINLYNFYPWHFFDWAWFQCFYQTKPFQTKPNLQQSYCCKSIINLNNIYSWHLIDFRPNFWVSPNQTLPNQTK